MHKTELASLWPEIKKLINDGISLIPVRDKDEGDRKAKTPYGSSWKEFQQRRMTEAELWNAMEYHQTTAIGVVCGEVSGWLECIDIDSKYEPGIDALILKDIAQMYPDIYNILRIHKTPSGGYHILYRIADHPVEPNQKLAGREATEQEIERQRAEGRKRFTTQINFLETRGEGGYVLYPPSMGYKVVQDVPISQITWEERCSLINICRSYDKTIKAKPSPKPTKKEDEWYTTNPFEDFNYNVDPVQLLEEFGWKKTNHENSRFIWFTRPGKGQGVSASFNKEKRIYYIFTSSTELEPSRGYNPASILAELKFNGDRKATYSFLVKQGYGVVKRQIEQALIKKAAIKGTGIPENFSEESKEEYQKLLERHKENHPFGTFWELNSQDEFTINIENFLHVAQQLGFRAYKGQVVQINGKFVDIVDDVYFFDMLKDYIKVDSSEDDQKIKNVYERFLKTYGKFISEKRLMKFDDEEILADTADTCYKFYANCFVEITAADVKIREYDQLNGLVWSHKILNRDYHSEAIASSLYQDYLRNATSINGVIPNNVKNVIGWLCHDYNSPARIYIVVLTEMVLDPKDGGGSGKNIFVNLLSNVIGVSTASGSMVKWDDKFFAVWKPGDRIYFIPDIPKKIDWPFLKNAVENPLVNKKYDKEISVSIEHTPKLVLNTNYSYSDSDGGLKRRIIPVEFTDFYTRNGGVDAVHGKLFPSAGNKGTWTDEDWKGFDDFIIHCIQYNLSNNGKLIAERLSEDGWMKKFINMYGEDNYDFIRDNITSWVKSQYIKVSDFQMQYDSYVNELKERYKLGKKTLMSAVREFCDRYNITFQQGKKMRVNRYESARVHTFEGDWTQFDNEDSDDGIPF